MSKPVMEEQIVIEEGLEERDEEIAEIAAELERLDIDFDIGSGMDPLDLIV